MHHEITKRMFDAFPADRKSDFWTGYLYLKYTEHFFNYSLEASGLESRKDLPPLAEGLEVMLKAMNWQIGENAMSTETSLYHGKVVQLKDALQLVTQKEDVHLSPPERVIPFKIARDVILENPGSIVVGTCPCRAASPNPCLPPGQQEVCLFLGDPWASFMDEQNPKYHKIPQEQAVKVLEFCHEKGFVHTAYFEHAVGNRLDALCSCCSCCCLGIKMWNLLDGRCPCLRLPATFARSPTTATDAGCAQTTSATSMPSAWMKLGSAQSSTRRSAWAAAIVPTSARTGR